jgi:hypothetical protein
MPSESCFTFFEGDEHPLAKPATIIATNKPHVTCFTRGSFLKIPTNRSSEVFYTATVLMQVQTSLRFPHHPLINRFTTRRASIPRLIAPHFLGRF